MHTHTHTQQRETVMSNRKHHNWTANNQKTKSLTVLFVFGIDVFVEAEFLHNCTAFALCSTNVTALYFVHHFVDGLLCTFAVSPD